jgi:hypothetical protein
MDRLSYAVNYCTERVQVLTLERSINAQREELRAVKKCQAEVEQQLTKLNEWRSESQRRDTDLQRRALALRNYDHFIQLDEDKPQLGDLSDAIGLAAAQESARRERLACDVATQQLTRELARLGQQNDQLVIALTRDELQLRQRKLLLQTGAVRQQARNCLFGAGPGSE